LHNRLFAEECDYTGHRNDGEGQKAGRNADYWGKDKDNSISSFRNYVFLKRQLNSISEADQDSTWAGSIWTNSKLHPRHNLSLAINGRKSKKNAENEYQESFNDNHPDWII
jgi:hypothetical protein